MEKQQTVDRRVKTLYEEHYNFGSIYVSKASISMIKKPIKMVFLYEVYENTRNEKHFIGIDFHTDSTENKDHNRTGLIQYEALSKPRSAYTRP